MAEGRKKFLQPSSDDQLRHFLAQNGGCVPLQELSNHLCNVVSAQLLNPESAIKKLREQKQSIIVLNLLANGPHAYLLTGVPLCHFYQVNDCKNGTSCKHFHVCKNYINNGSCQKGDLCKLSHTFHDKASNQGIIERLDFQDLNDKTLQKIVSNSLPHVCNAYNTLNCTSAYCAKIHICWKYVEGTCQKKEKCEMLHNFLSEHNLTIIRRYNLSKILKKYLISSILNTSGTQEIEWLEDEDEITDQSEPIHRINVGQGARSKSLPSSINKPTKEKKTEDQPVKEKIKNQPAKNIEDKVQVNLIFHHIVSKHEGRVRLQDFIDHHPANITIQDADLPSWFDKHQNQFVLNKKASGQLDSVSILEPRARICIEYCSIKRGCSKVRCDFFHLCRGYVNSMCTFKESSCKFNHTLECDREKGLIEKLGLQQFTDSEVLTIIKHSVPSVCKKYNESACLKADACPQLHICDGFVANDNSFCTDPSKCTRSHVLTADHEQTILKQFRIDRMRNYTILQMVSPSHKKTFQLQPKKRIPTARPDNPKRSPLHNGENITICEAFLCGKSCPKNDKCPEHHWSVPYAWRWKLEGETEWKIFGGKTTDTLETNYCNIVDTISIDMSGPSLVELDLNRLSASYQDDKRSLSYAIERLSTVSSVEASSGNRFATKWLWYWQDDDKSWKPYNAILTDKIEKAFIQKNSLVNFEIAPFKYTLGLQGHWQRQQNLSTLKCRPVRRRPTYVPRTELKQAQGAIPKPLAVTHQPILEQPILPSEWEPMGEKEELKQVELPRDSEEFRKVDQEFLKTLLGKFSIVRVHRIQNPFLWKKFTHKKIHMETKLPEGGDKVVGERFLFHGTSKDTTQAICRQNFDWRLCGKHGTAYGQGTYFARDASYSHGYSSRSDSVPLSLGTTGLYGRSSVSAYSVFHMFLAKVLVGSYTQGSSSLKRPPPLNPSDSASDLYDSCVDQTTNPSMFIVFESDQYYPQYLIEYNQSSSLY